MSKGELENLVGRRFERLLVLEPAIVSTYRETAWLCICDCKNTKVVKHSDLLSLRVRSCGCLQRERSSSDLTGKTFGKLTVTGKTGERRNGYVVWECECECKNITTATTKALISETKRSCGCLLDGRYR